MYRIVVISGLFALIAAGLIAGGSTTLILCRVPVEFALFALTLLGVALFHHHTLQVALIGLVVITAYKLGFSDFHGHTGFGGIVLTLKREGVGLVNLLLLLLGFDLLAHHFSASKIPAALPKVLPNGWMGGFILLSLIFVLSSFLDNIAAAMIGGTVAASVFKGRVHVGYLAGIVAAANAGGAGSVVGDTTTTMMWIDGVSPVDVLHAFLPAVVALLVCGVVASIQQHRHQPIIKDSDADTVIDWGRVLVVAVILVFAIAANLIINLVFSDHAEDFPWIGAAVWLGILVTASLRKPHWGSLPAAATGAVFLLALVLAAAMLPVEKLPDASWQTALGLGFVSAGFNNIPLVALALHQGGYDWGMLAYCVGFGGSMLWFGSSAGVAIASGFHESRSVVNWVKHGWHVTLAFVVGFFVMLVVVGWHPHAPHRAEHRATHGSALSP